MKLTFKMYDRVLYDRIIDETPIPNGIQNDKLIAMITSREDWGDFTVFSELPKFKPESIALTSESDSGIYPICIREASILSKFFINSLLLDFDETLLSLVRSGSIKLVWFVMEEPPHDLYQIFEIERVMRSWEISNYSLFCNLPPSIVSRSACKNAYSAPHHLDFVKFNDIHNGSGGGECERVVQAKRFNCFMNTRKMYDWRLLVLDSLRRRGVLKNAIYSFNDSAPMIKTYNFYVEYINSYLAQHELQIRCALDKDSYSDLSFHDAFEKSKMSIVIEAYLNYDTVVDHTFITEKTFRPIFNLKPFVIFGQSHSLSCLHERGYRTFHPHIDESYDRIDDDLLRIKTLTEEIVRINAMSHDEFEHLLKTLQPIIEHNANNSEAELIQYQSRIFERV